MKQSLFERFTHAHMPPTRFFKFEYDPDQCTGCKACFTTCPTSCIQWDDDKKQPYVTGLGNIELACIGCNNCEVVCPAGCIRMRGEYKVLKGLYKTPEERQGDMLPPRPFGEKDIDRSFEDISKDLTETEKVIYKRRSVRMFKNKPVEKDLINRILEAGRYAPSSGNCQAFKFLVVTDKKMIQRVNQAAVKFLYRVKDFYVGNGRWRSAMINMLGSLKPNLWDQRPFAAVEKISQNEGDITFNAPVVIHVLKDTRGITDPDVDAAIAAQNMVLTAHSLGLGTCYIGFIASSVFYAPKIKRLLKIKYPYEMVLSICLGYPKVTYDKPVHRGRVAVDWIE